LAVSMRLRREGAKHQPCYRVVVADRRAPRDGKFIEILGTYRPVGGDSGVNLNEERILYWLGQGAQPSDTVRSLLRKAGILKKLAQSRAS